MSHHDCVLYDRSCRLKQCFRCHEYGHIVPQCDAEERCGYCAEKHNTKECMKKLSDPKQAPLCRCARASIQYGAVHAPEEEKSWLEWSKHGKTDLFSIMEQTIQDVQQGESQQEIKKQLPCRHSASQEHRTASTADWTTYRRVQPLASHTHMT